ncbi:arylsulfatase A-like enzyme [Haloactinopolyspora alba]|uniref:Arylsulfatase A-like enzyme n=1 Tax=Haloactinopolyspora alba TaxID=648780 RepID=A0A2P8DGP2_9ACTN|nr:sulfatase [Haloactinopolyspora alba]PSK96400.1 arylsulfatase A-like enzyme [Haloactinopolyspora alba]
MAQQSRGPSILLVFADQMRGRDMGCAGNPEVRTPALDALAADGVRATHCYATVPVCTPNRASLLTGLYPTTHRTVGNDLPLAAAFDTIGNVAADAGYRTGYVGKWHLDGVPRSRFTPPGPRRQGFDFWASYNCTHDYFTTQYFRDEPEAIVQQRYEPEVQTDLAEEFLTGLDDDDAFLLALSWGPPHDPYDMVPERFREQYSPEDVTLPPNVVTATDNPLADGLDTRRTIADYYAAITALDEQFARLTRTLERLGRRDDTIVVFTSDHGDMLWAHGWMKKQLPYEESVHVPLIVRAPGDLPAGTTFESPVATVDLAPTILALAGLPVPPAMEGTDVSGPLRGEGDGLSSVFLGNTAVMDEAVRQNASEWRAVRTERYTYAEVPGRKPWLLFDNDTDPWQRTNLIDEPAHEQTRLGLAHELGAFLERVGDPFLPTEELIDHVGMREAWDARQRGFDAVGPTPADV